RLFRLGEQRMFMLMDNRQTAFPDKPDTGVQSGDAGKIVRTGLKTVRHDLRLLLGSRMAAGSPLGYRHDWYMVRHVQESGSPGPEQPLMTGHRQQVNSQAFNVDRQITGRLRRINQKQRVNLAAEIRQLLDRLNRAADVRDMADSDHPGIALH